VGQYQLLGEIARGGMGVVYKACDRKLNRIVALKVTRAGHIASGDEAKRFQGEAEAAAKLDHPHIVPIYEVGEVDGLQFISMAFIEGRSLTERVATGPLPPREAAAILRPVADAVAYAHTRGVIHRDLKPGNIMLDAAGQPRVTDFGLAKRTDADSSLTQAGQVIGTPSYMSPEQAEGKNEQVGPLADVYALGTTLYCLVTGRPPFQSASVVETLKQVTEREPVAPHFLNPAVDRDLETICLKCLQKTPERRYASAAAVSEDLQRYLARRPIQARPVGGLEILIRWCRRNPLAATSLSSIIAVFAIAFVLVSWSYWQAEQRQKAERWERYRATMIAAGAAMQLHNVAAAQSTLQAAPAEYRSWEWKYLHHQLDTAQQVIRFGDNIKVINISPDCTIAAVQPAVGPARLWNLSTRQESASLTNRTSVPWFEFSPDGKTLACPVEDLNRSDSVIPGSRDRQRCTSRQAGPGSISHCCTAALYRPFSVRNPRGFSGRP
jgi:predicted Ser/Thr protein kinase